MHGEERLLQAWFGFLMMQGPAAIVGAVVLPRRLFPAI